MKLFYCMSDVIYEGAMSTEIRCGVVVANNEEDAIKAHEKEVREIKEEVVLDVDNITVEEIKLDGYAIKIKSL